MPLDCGLWARYMVKESRAPSPLCSPEWVEHIEFFMNIFIWTSRMKIVGTLMYSLLVTMVKCLQLQVSTYVRTWWSVTWSEFTWKFDRSASYSNSRSLCLEATPRQIWWQAGGCRNVLDQCWKSLHVMLELSQVLKEKAEDLRRIAYRKSRHSGIFLLISISTDFAK